MEATTGEVESRYFNRELVSSWQRSLHRKQPRTREFYREELDRFVRWLVEAGRPRGHNPGDLLAVKRADAEAWIGDLQDAGRAKATIRSRWVALRSFYNWLVDVEELDTSPFAKVVAAKGEPPAIAVLDDDQLADLLRACEGRGFYDRRDMAIVRMLAATGVRVSELCDIKLADLDLDARLARVEGKGGHHRVVRFDPATAAALDRYKRARARHRLAAMPWLFLGPRGRLSRKGVPWALQKRADRAGIGHIHPHMLRHTFAHRFLEAGGNEGDLQKLGGWANSEVMRRYGASRAVARALNAYDQTNPMGEL